MNKELEQKAIEMRAEASRWLLTVQAALCSVMWGGMEGLMNTAPLAGLVMLLSWMGFAFSTVLSAILIGLLPRLTEALDQPAVYEPRKKQAELLRSAQLACFLGGAGFALLAALIKTAWELAF